MIRGPGARKPSHRSQRSCSVFAVFVVFLATSAAAAFIIKCYAVLYRGNFAATTTASFVQGTAKSPPQVQTDMLEPETLVIYLLLNRDPVYHANFRFFVDRAVGEDDGCEYIFVLQLGSNNKRVDTLPKLPPNARYVEHTEMCEWGTLGWILSSEEINIELYKYFILMNSSVRGPFMPSYIQPSFLPRPSTVLLPAGTFQVETPADRENVNHWAKFFTHKLNGRVKAVGPTISCEGLPASVANASQTIDRMSNPHVQSRMIATDQVGLQLMRQDGRVFQCYDSVWDGILYSELGSSWVVLAAGYNLDSFMLRYQGVDWSDKRNWDCNARVNPVGEMYYDGISLNPLEIMFVTMDSVLMLNQWSFTRMSAKYDKWWTEQAAGRHEVVSNPWKSNSAALKTEKIAYMQARGPTCFDAAYYASVNPDLGHFDRAALWEHFVTMGQFEGRLYRFTCAYPRT